MPPSTSNSSNSNLERSEEVLVSQGRRRILHLVPNSSLSGFHQSFWEHASADGYELDFLSFDPEGPMHAWVRERGANAWSLRTRTETIWAGKAFVQLLGVLAKRRYSLVHLFGLCSLASGLPAARCAGVRRVVYNHWYGRELFLYRGKWFSRWLDRTCSLRVDHLVAVSDDLVDYLRDELRIPPERISLIPFGFDFSAKRLGPEERRALRKQHGWGNDFVVGCVARLHWTKGQRYLLEAMAEAKRRTPRPIRAVFLGEGPDRHELERYAKELGLAQQVQFLGQQSDVWTYFQLMDVLAHPSMQHAYEQVIAEAMGVGTPVLSTRVGIAREIIVSGENGWLVPERNSAAIADILGEISQKPLTAVAQAALNTAQRKIGTKRSMIDAYDRLYQRLLASA